MIRRAKHFYEFGQFRLDEGERLLLRDGQPVPLAPKVFDTLLALVKDRGHLIEKEALMKELWPDTFVEDSNLTYNISQLRKALGDGDGQRLIETVPRRGYRFLAPVRECGEENAFLEVEERSEVPAVIEEEITEHKSFVSVWKTLAVALAALQCAGLVYIFRARTGPVEVRSVASFLSGTLPKTFRMNTWPTALRTR